MREGVPLAPLTTFKIGGAAEAFLEIKNEKELREAILTSQNRDFSFAILGGGSNLLVPDEGIRGLVIKMAIPGITFEENGVHMRIVLGAGVSWDAAVDAASERTLWGIENLAGIPGTAGGAVVQNIGAYGAELKDVFEWADVFDLSSGISRRITKSEAAFAYRDSLFKKNRALIITRVALLLREAGEPNLAYKDLQSASASTPGQVADLVRSIRANKFPDLRQEGTAGSFFKNPIIDSEQAQGLRQEFPDLPQFVQPDGRVKIALAWMLDHALGLRGFTMGKARLFERQPLVIVAKRGTSSREIEELAHIVERKIFALTSIRIEREVENFSTQKLSTGRA